MLTLLRVLYGSPRVPAAFEPVREDPAIKWHADHVVVPDPVVEDALHKAVSAERRLDMAL